MDDLGHGERQDREMHTRRSDAERAGDGRGDCCRHHPGQQVRLQGVDVQQGVEKSARIGAEAEVGRMPERKEPGGAQKQVEGETGNREGEGRGEKDQVVGWYECRKKECRHSQQDDRESSARGGHNLSFVHAETACKTAESEFRNLAGRSPLLPCAQAGG